MRQLLKNYVLTRIRLSEHYSNLTFLFHHVMIFRSLVDNWLGYYRGTLGVTKAPVASSRVNRPSLLSRSRTFSPRSVFSSGEGDTTRPTTRLTSCRTHSRSSTYPMSSRPTSRLGTWNQESMQPMHQITNSR